MSRIIDADALIKDIDDQIKDVCTDNTWAAHMTAFVADRMKHLIDRQPTVCVREEVINETNSI